MFPDWYFKDVYSQIIWMCELNFQDKIQPGVSGESAWLKITNLTGPRVLVCFDWTPWMASRVYWAASYLKDRTFSVVGFFSPLCHCILWCSSKFHLGSVFALPLCYILPLSVVFLPKQLCQIAADVRSPSLNAIYGVEWKVKTLVSSASKGRLDILSSQKWTFFGKQIHCCC